MKLLLQPPKFDSPSFEIDHQIQIAVAALQGYLIRIRGAGRFADGAAAILLARDSDADIAVAALRHVGICATASEVKQRERPVEHSSAHAYAHTNTISAK